MSLRDVLGGACADIVTTLAESGWTWQANTTTGNGAPVYGTATPLVVVWSSGVSDVISGDADTERENMITIRVPSEDAVSLPVVRDRVTDPASRVYVVERQSASGYGTVQYELRNITRVALGSNRGRDA